MTTSGVTSWSLTARDIVTQAMTELGVLASGEQPEASEMDNAIVRLNAMLKSWQGKANLFREAELEVTITGGNPTVTLPADVRDVSSARVVVSASYHRPIFAWNRAQYLFLPNKVAVGSPTAFYLSKGVGAPMLNVWPVPAEDTTIKLDYSRLGETVTDPSQTLDIPEEWQEAVYLGLAARIAGMFGATRVDPNTVGEVKQRAAMLEQQMLDQDRPDSYYFEPAYD